MLTGEIQLIHLKNSLASEHEAEMHLYLYGFMIFKTAVGLHGFFFYGSNTIIRFAGHSGH